MHWEHMVNLMIRRPWWWNWRQWAVFVGRMALILIAAGCGILSAGAPACLAADGHVFLLTRDGESFDLELVPIPDGETRVFQGTPESGVIDVIIPVGPGGSGSVAQTGQTRMFVARNVGGEMRVSVQDASGNKHDYPNRRMSDLAGFDTRLSVISDDRQMANFTIDAYSSAQLDTVGPVMDLFGGAIPLNKGDYVITTFTQPAATDQKWSGTIPLDYNNGYLFAKVVGPDGREGTFAVDIGASKTIVQESFLPDSTEIIESYMMEYSSNGARKLKYEPGGATGPVRTVTGQATLPNVTIGDIALTNVGVDVITSLPELRGTKIDGIIGMNILRAGANLRIQYGSGRSSHPSLTITDQSLSADSDLITLPISRNGETLYVRGSVNGTPVYFILDSGSPDCVMPPQSLAMTGAALKSDTTVTYHGGGGQEWTGRYGILDDLSVGGQPFPGQDFMIGDILVLQRLAQHQASGLLGNSFFARFAAMEIDFEAGVVRFAKL